MDFNMSAKSAIDQRLQNLTGRSMQGCDEVLKKFSNQIEQYYIDEKQPVSEMEKKKALLKEIEAYLISNVFNQRIAGRSYQVKAVVPFGSSASALGMKGGDLDMIICVHPALGPGCEHLVKERTNDILGLILNHIQSGRMLGNRRWVGMEHRRNARVPIVTGMVDGIELDISISMTESVCPQYLVLKYIDAYAKYDRRFILLAAFVKAWQKAKQEGKPDEYCKSVFLNSCSTVLLVIFFMKHYGLLPNVNVKHEDRLGEAYLTWARVVQGENGSFGLPNRDVSNWKQSNQCDVTVGTLFLLFLDFYTNIVDFQSKKLVMETGVLQPKSYYGRGDEILIEDVIDKQNPAGGVKQIEAYKKYLKDALDIVKGTDAKNIKEKLMTNY